MTAQALSELQLSPDEYLAWELENETKHEYLGGQIVAMAGASDRHGLIAMAFAAILHPLARKRGCQLFMADMKVRIHDGRESYFYYPDLMLACDADDRESAYYRERPCLLVEVTSHSTARIDRREKLFAYRQIPGLREYIIVDQNERCVDLFRYPEREHETWTQGSFHLNCLDADVSVDALYVDADA